MIKSAFKIIVLFFLGLFAQIFSVHAQYATGGSSVYRDQVLWVTWGGGPNGTHDQVLGNGSTSTATVIVAEGQELKVEFSIERASGKSLKSYRPGTWGGIN